MNLDKLVRAAIMLSRLLADFVKPVINRLKPCRITFQRVTGAADGGSGLGKLGIGARALLRTGEDEYKALGLADASLDEAQLIDAMVSHPKLIERPILVAGDKAVVGRPPEKVLELLA